MFGVKVLFLDIDGVLNDHISLELTDSCGIKRSCVDQLNIIIHNTDCDVVISSAWRYMILGGAMTIRGFEYMLRTHGVSSKMNILDTTKPDESIATRADQVADWLKNYKTFKINNYCVVDDIDFGFSKANMNFVKTDGAVGLTEIEANKIIEILNK